MGAQGWYTYASQVTRGAAGATLSAYWICSTVSVNTHNQKLYMLIIRKDVKVKQKDQIVSSNIQ